MTNDERTIALANNQKRIYNLLERLNKKNDVFSEKIHLLLTDLNIKLDTIIKEVEKLKED